MKGLFRGFMVSVLLLGFLGVCMIPSTAPNAFAAGEPIGEELRIGTLVS